MLDWFSTTVNKYNGRDQVTEVIQYEGAESPSNTHQTTSMTYDGHGRPATLHKPEYAASTNTTTTYNVDDTVATVIDPRSAVTTYTYGNPDVSEKRPSKMLFSDSHLSWEYAFSQSHNA